MRGPTLDNHSNVKKESPYAISKSCMLCYVPRESRWSEPSFDGLDAGGDLAAIELLHEVEHFGVVLAQRRLGVSVGHRTEPQRRLMARRQRQLRTEPFRFKKKKSRNVSSIWSISTGGTCAAPSHL